jgi:hypothetical protein
MDIEYNRDLVTLSTSENLNEIFSFRAELYTNKKNARKVMIRINDNHLSLLLQGDDNILIPVEDYELKDLIGAQKIESLEKDDFLVKLSLFSSVNISNCCGYKRKRELKVIKQLNILEYFHKYLRQGSKFNI